MDAVTGATTAWAVHASNRVYALAVSGTTVYIGGDFTVVRGRCGFQTRYHVAALDATTGCVTAWNPGGQGGVTSVYALAVSGPTVFVGGNFSTLGGEARSHLAAVDSATGQAEDWDPRGNGNVFALGVSGNAVFAGGTFTGMGGEPRNYLAALDAITGRPLPWNPDPNSSVWCLAADGARVYAGGYFSSIGGQAREYLAALDATTGQATAFDAGDVLSLHEVFIWALAASGPTLYVGGYFFYIGGQSRSNLAALDATTGEATAWNPRAGYQVHALAVSGNTVYVGGTFPWIGSQTRNYIAAVDATTGLATDWDPNADQTVLALAVSGSTVYAGGYFTRIGGQDRSHVAALDAATGLATDWDPQANGMVNALAIGGPAVYAGGRFTSVGGQPRDRIAALDVTTGRATAWNPGADGEVRTLAVGDVMVYAGGDFRSMGNLPQSYIAAIGDVSTPTLLSLVDAQAAPDRVRLRWFAAGGPVLATVYRRTVDTAWQAQGQVSEDGTGHIVFEDAHVRAGLRYGYRLGVLQAGQEAFMGEVWVDVPRAHELALAGARPNPVLSDLTVAFSLPDGQPARLELMDLAGRRIIARDLGALGAGSHVVNLGPSRELAPGVYLLRLTQGARSLVTRAAVMR